MNDFVGRIFCELNVNKKTRRLVRTCRFVAFEANKPVWSTDVDLDTVDELEGKHLIRFMDVPEDINSGQAFEVIGEHYETVLKTITEHDPFGKL